MEVIEYGSEVVFKEMICDSCKSKIRYNNLEVKKRFDAEEYFGTMYTTEEHWIKCPVCGTKHTLVFDVFP